MDAGAFCALQGLAGTVDVFVQSASQTANCTVFNGVGNGLHRFKVALAGSRKTGLYHIDF